MCNVTRPWPCLAPIAVTVPDAAFSSKSLVSGPLKKPRDLSLVQNLLSYSTFISLIKRQWLHLDPEEVP